MRLMCIQWGDFVELVEMEKQGVVVWLSSNTTGGESRQPQHQHPSASAGVSDHIKEETDGDLQNEDAPKPKPTSRSTKARMRLKRAQTADYGLTGPPPSLIPPTNPPNTHHHHQKAIDLEAAMKAQQLIDRHSDDDTLDTAGPQFSSPSIKRKGGIRGLMGGSERNRGNLVHSMTVAEKEFDPSTSNRFLIGRESITSKSEIKRREAVWDLFQSENAFLIDHLMVLKNVSFCYTYSSSSSSYACRVLLEWSKASSNFYSLLLKSEFDGLWRYSVWNLT